MDGADELMEDLLRSYTDRAPGFLDRLDDAVQRADWALVEAEAHRFKGIAANLGIDEVASTCQRLMAASDQHSPGETAALVRTLRDEHRRADAAIIELLPSPEPTDAS
jgi:HPt (histidine-containing phosphotransfer) domain-containing protein